MVSGLTALDPGGHVVKPRLTVGSMMTGTVSASVSRAAHLALIALLVVAACQPATPEYIAPATANPTAAIAPTTKPTAKPTTKPKPTTKATAAPADVYYQNCAAVRAAGKDPLHRDDPGYRAGLDRDKDGLACE